MRCGEEGMGVRNIAGMLPGKGDAGRKGRGGGGDYGGQDGVDCGV